MKIKIIFATLLIAFFASLSAPLISSAQIPFGGRVLQIDECGCSGGLYVLFFDYLTLRTVPMVFQFGASRLNREFTLAPNVHIVGSYFPGGVCLQAKTDCSALPVQGTITSFPFPGVGTSGLISIFGF